MTDIYLPELMELDSYWESAIKDAAENTVHNTKRLEFALQNRKKINKILESSSYNPVIMAMMRNSQKHNKSTEESMDDDDDELTVSSYNNNLQQESSTESMNEAENEENTKSGPSTKRKVKLAPAKRNLCKGINRTCFRDKEGRKIKKGNVEFVQDPLDEDHTDKKKSSPSRCYSKINPYVPRKRKLPVITAEIKRKKRNESMKRHEKRTKMLKTKRSRKVEPEPRNDNKCDEKPDENSKNQETKVDNSNNNEPNSKVNNEDIKNSAVPGKETPATKKVSQNGSKGAGNPTNPPKPEKGQAKGNCKLNANPKENVISKYGDLNEKMIMAYGMQGLPRLYNIERSNRNCPGSRKRKYKRRRQGKKRISPFIKFYLTVYQELCGTCSIKSIAKEAGKRWKCMSCKEKLKFYPKNSK